MAAKKDKTEDKAGPVKREKHPIPMGWVTPSDFCVYVNFHESLDGMKLEAPNVHALAKRDDFASSTNHSDGRLIMELEPSILWFKERKDELESKRAERESNRENRQVAKVRAMAKNVAAFAKAAGF